MPRYSMKQRAALDALMRDDVYRRAREIIEAEGLHGLTLDRLAKRIGVSRGTLYNYFSDRDAIVSFVEERTFEPVFAVLREIAAGAGGAAQKLEAIAHEVFDSVRENLTLVVALSPEKFSGRDKRIHLERRERGFALFRDLVREGIDSGEFRDVSPELVSEVLFGAITGLIDNMAYGGAFRKPEEIVPALMETVLRGLKR
jgi:AcrR family transcriptional regulator